MNNNFYYLGLKKKTIQNNNFFKQAIVLDGGGVQDISYNKDFGVRLDYNDLSNFKRISEYYDEKILQIQAMDKNCKFMLYNQASIKFIKNKENVVCFNDYNLIKKLNNKPECRELLKDAINVLDYKLLQSKDISYEKINKLFGRKNGVYVIQQPVGFAGVGTYLVNKNNCDDVVKTLNKDMLYSISSYVDKAVSLNNTFLISDHYIHIFAGSIQKIEKNEQLEYNGWDFYGYQKLNDGVKEKAYNQTYEIARKLQSLGYRGIGGVDYITKNNEVFFMEINPRFQASSEELDKMLIQKGLPSIFELNYYAFYNEKKCKQFFDLLNQSKIEQNIDLKIKLMVSGINLSDNARKELIIRYGKKFYNDDYVTTTGIMVELRDNLFLTCHLNEKSKYVINFFKNQFYLKVNKNIYSIKIWGPSKNIIGKINKFGPISDYVNIHFDRARINPITGCSFHCAFCSFNQEKYRKNLIQELDCALEEALKDKRVTHVLISGGSPKEEDLPYLTQVYEYFCNKYKDLDFDVMLAPRGFDSYNDESQYENYLKYLKKIGVKGLSINIELSNKEICGKYCIEKSSIGLERYLKFLKYASDIFGTLNVRSGLIVGLESKEDTLKAVEEICKVGCMPMLSPYVPYRNIGKYPTAKFLKQVFVETKKILKKYNIPLAPLCDMCRHNTL